MNKFSAVCAAIIIIPPWFAAVVIVRLIFGKDKAASLLGVDTLSYTPPKD